MATTFHSPPPRKTHNRLAQRQPSTPPRQRRLVGNRVVSPAMDVDTHIHHDRDRTHREKDTTFAKTEELTVGLYGSLPVEVRHVLRGAGMRNHTPIALISQPCIDFLAESYVGGIDNTSGYTLIASARTCYVWPHATLKPSSPSPTCYILPCPPPSAAHPSATPQAPHYAIVPSRTRTVEPGLILISTTGTARFWPSISSGLSGGGVFDSIEIPLDASGEEYVSCLARIPQPGPSSTFVYLAATSMGRIFRLMITSHGGKHTLSTKLFAPPPTSSSLSLTRLFGIGWTAPSPAARPEPGNVVTLVSSGDSIFALVETRIQQWTLSSEDIFKEMDVADSIREAIGSGIGVEDLEGIDLAVEGCVWSLRHPFLNLILCYIAQTLLFFLSRMLPQHLRKALAQWSWTNTSMDHGECMHLRDLCRTKPVGAWTGLRSFPTWLWVHSFVVHRFAMLSYSVDCGITTRAPTLDAASWRCGCSNFVRRCGCIVCEEYVPYILFLPNFVITVVQQIRHTMSDLFLSHLLTASVGLLLSHRWS